MRFDIRHVTTYRYDRAVFLEPHTIRLRPRDGADQRLELYDLHIDPAPQGMSQFIDAQGNAVAMAWFDGMTESLTVTSECVVHATRVNPFDYLLSPDAMTLPIGGLGRESASLSHALQRGVIGSGDDPVGDFARVLAEEADQGTQAFLGRLCAELYETCEVIVREEGPPLPPTQVLVERRAACRGVAMLFIDACRSVGLPARFVSGYQQGDDDQPDRHLHAWAEVYLPGAGWRGYDPTHGLVVADRHVALAAAADPLDAAPVSGSFRGTGAKAEFEYRLDLNTHGALSP